MMTRLAPVRRLSSLIAAIAVVLFPACLKNGKVEPGAERECTCSGTRCIGGVVSLVTNDSDDESDPCLGCHMVEIGRCVAGCGSDSFEVPGCQAAFACHSWDRQTPGTACSDTHQCEPGPAGAAAPNALECRGGVCVDLGAEKWPSTAVVPARECTGDPFFGPHPSCGGAACLAKEPYGAHRYCSAAKCLEDADCPPDWFCRCLEEYQRGGVRAERWCVPDIGGKFPPSQIVPLGSGGH